MAIWHKVTVDVISAGVDVKEASAHAEETAWDMAVHAAEHEGVDIGSDKFVSAYNQLKVRFDDCAESYSHLHHVSARAVQALLNKNTALLVKDISSDKLEDAIHDMVATVFSVLTVVYATGPHGWIHDEEWLQLTEKERTVPITFHAVDLSDEETTDEYR